MGSPGTLQYEAEPGHDTPYKSISETNQRECICNDSIFAVLFVIYFVFTLICAGLWGSGGLDDLLNGETDHLNDNLVFSLIGLAALGFSFALLWSCFMAFFSAWFINVALAFIVLMLIGAGVYSSWQAYHYWSTTWFWVPGVVFGIAAGLVLIYACLVQNRIHFASANLRVASKGLLHNWGSFVIAVLTSFVQVGWFFAWVAGTQGICNHYALNDGACTGTWFAMIFGYFWGIFVLKGLIAVTVAGALSRWWSNPQNSNFRSARAVGRALTSYFGSIAFGSLFTALLETIAYILRSMAWAAGEGGSCLTACILGCAAALVQLVESLVEYFNKYAFAYIGVNGDTFCNSGAAAIQLFKDRGWTTIINDDLVDNVLFMGSVCSGLVCFFVGYELGENGDFNDIDDASWTLGFLGLLMGFSTAHIVFGTVSSAVTTVFVCFAEKPDDLKQNHPEEFENIEDAWLKIYPTAYQNSIREGAPINREA